MLIKKFPKNFGDKLDKDDRLNVKSISLKSYQTLFHIRAAYKKEILDGGIIEPCEVATD